MICQQEWKTRSFTAVLYYLVFSVGMNYAIGDKVYTLHGTDPMLFCIFFMKVDQMKIHQEWLEAINSRLNLKISKELFNNEWD